MNEQKEPVLYHSKEILSVRINYNGENEMIRLSSTEVINAMAYLGYLNSHLSKWDEEGSPVLGYEISFDEPIVVAKRTIGRIDVHRLTFDFKLEDGVIVATNELSPGVNMYEWLVTLLNTAIKGSVHPEFRELSVERFTTTIDFHTADGRSGMDLIRGGFDTNGLEKKFSTARIKFEDEIVLIPICPIGLGKGLVVILNNGKFWQLATDNINNTPAQLEDLNPFMGYYLYMRNYIPWNNEEDVPGYLSVYSV